jgi:hypothetical protein
MLNDISKDREVFILRNRQSKKSNYIPVYTA